jgi:hypothetical protein
MLWWDYRRTHDSHACDRGDSGSYSKGEYLGSVEAPDRERAEAVAIKKFALDDDQRRRLQIRERH